jgi:exonuclease SbcC
VYHKGVSLKLISLELTNYRRFKEANIDFPEGVIGILGLNGVGKSTIIEAIAWVLYGNEAKIVRTGKEDLKRYGAATSDEVAVKLDFELEGDKYTVLRRMKGKNFQTNAEVTINGKSAATSTKSVTSLIEDKLGMDYQAFYTSVFAKQKELNALSVLDPSKRKKLILRMLSIDSIDKAIISVRGDKRDTSTKLDVLRSELVEPDGTPKLEKFKKEVQDLEVVIKSAAEKLKSMEGQKKKLQKELANLEKVRSSQRKLRDEYNKLANKSTELKTKIENIATQQKKIESDLKSLSKHEEELKKLQPKIDDWNKIKVRKEELDKLFNDFIRSEELKKQLAWSQKQKGKYQAQMEKASAKKKKFETLDKDLEKCQNDLKKIHEDTDEYKRNISESMTRQKHMESDIGKLEDKLKEIRELGPDSACPTCERPLKAQFEFLEEKLTAELEKISVKQLETTNTLQANLGQLGDSEKRQEALKKREKYLNQELAEHARLEETLKAANLELKQNTDQEQELKAELDKYGDLKFDNTEFERVKKKYKDLEKIKEKSISLKERVEARPKLVDELEKLKATDETLATQQQKLKKQIENLGFNKAKMEQLENEYDEASSKQNAFILKLKEKENDLKLHKKDITQLKNQIEDVKTQEEKTEVLKSDVIYLAKLVEMLDKFKNYMISRIAPTLTQFASELFRDLTDGRYNRMEVDNDYNVLIYDNGQEFPLERFSGGEEDLANLCLRLAISQVIAAQTGSAELNFVILDEVFGSQDVYRKRNLLRALTALTNKFRQIFLITHIEDVKEYIEYNISVLGNDDGTSEVKVM